MLNAVLELNINWNIDYRIHFSLSLKGWWWDPKSQPRIHRLRTSNKRMGELGIKFRQNAYEMLRQFIFDVVPPSKWLEGHQLYSKLLQYSQAVLGSSPSNCLRSIKPPALFGATRYSKKQCREVAMYMVLRRVSIWSKLYLWTGAKDIPRILCIFLISTWNFCIFASDVSYSSIVCWTMFMLWLICRIAALWLKLSPLDNFSSRIPTIVCILFLIFCKVFSGDRWSLFIVSLNFRRSVYGEMMSRRCKNLC